MSWQRCGTVRDQRERLNPLSFGKCVNPLGNLVASRFGWQVHPHGELDSIGLDEDRDKVFLGMEPDHVGDDGQKIIWSADLEPTPRHCLWRPAAAALLSLLACRFSLCRFSLG